MPDSYLHAFDLQLCWYVAYNARQLNLSGKKPASELLGELLLSYVEAVGSQRVWLHGPNLLLNEYDFNRIAWVVGLFLETHSGQHSRRSSNCGRTAPPRSPLT